MHRFTAIPGLLLCIPVLTCAEPAIDSVSVTGTLGDGAAITLNGSGFGDQGPSIRLYDDFEDGGTAGEVVDLNPVIGSWFDDLPHNELPTFDDIGYSGDLSMRVHDGVDSDGFLIIKTAFDPATEMFLSYWLQVPLGFKFPGADIANTIPTAPNYVPKGAASTWKLVWMFDGDGNTNDNDIVLPTHNNGALRLFGNNTEEISQIRVVDSGVVDQSDSLFKFGQWVRITVWLQADNSDLLGPAMSRYTLEVPTAGISKEELSDKPVFSTSNGDKPPYRWTHMNFTGWTGKGGSDWSGTRPLFDEVYLATGAGAQARVEICDAALHGDCERFGYVTMDSADWSGTTIMGTIRSGALAGTDLSSAYLYVYDADGAVNPEGFLLCGDCPRPPTGVEVE